MEDKQYWDLSDEDRKKQDVIEAKEDEPKMRFYLWDYCKSYGWRACGTLQGYETLEELKADHGYSFNVEQNNIQKILKAKVIED